MEKELTQHLSVTARFPAVWEPFTESPAFLLPPPGRPADKMVVVPWEPVVRYGGSVELNCSLACAGGTVQRKGLDTNLGSVTSSPTHSVLHISSAVVATEGTKICQGSCHGQHYQHTVILRVYALPDALQLEVDPGQPDSLRCSARNVYPITEVEVTWYWGDQVLEKAAFDDTETDEELYDIVSTLPVAGKDVGEGVEFRCKVTLSVGQETFSRVASVTVRPRGECWGGSWGPGFIRWSQPPLPLRCLKYTDPTTALTTTPWEPDTETMLETAAAHDPPSTQRSAPCDLVTGSPMARPATATFPGSGTTSPPAEAQGTAADSTSWGSSPAEKGTGLSVGTVPACLVTFWSLKLKHLTRGRALSIECHAGCAGNATVRWLQTPAALSQYREEVSESSSTLRLDRAEPQHQGHYQCTLLGHGSQVVSLQLMVLDDSFSTGPAIAMGTTVSLLGLIVSGIMSHRLWKRFRSRYELS
ncbi:mucosal addressin cell adhesion molecule 1 [Egretta garzetta]|uniref:mucosal addressin cell adhesion molecule 1 n=1 Tax=Egretta garzetta TaxID=188379 RepID=UPI00163D0DAC|nr:mucosal addressin cell adhesion molecule 1 [Egretta garzetta]